MTITLEEALDIKQIHPHPKNPRRRAVADDEMVASVKARGLIQPLILAPAAAGDGYVVLAGHRRLDALKKARVKTAPALIRGDITKDAEQIEFAIIENVHRQDLTPVEEAEAFAELQHLKYTQKQIADKTGRPVATVRERLKLLKLSKSTQDALHQGQLSIGNALDIASFEDPKVQKELQRAAGTSGFAGALESAKRKRARAGKVLETEKKMTADGVPKRDCPADVHGSWGLEAEKHGMVTLSHTHSPIPADHPGCLAYVLEPNWFGYGEPYFYVCTDPASHVEQLDDEEKTRRAEGDRREAERLAEVEAREVSHTVRIAAVSHLFESGIAMHPRLRDLVRSLLPALVWRLYGDVMRSYQDAMEIAKGHQWSGNNEYSRNDQDVARFLAHVADLGTADDQTLARAVAIILAEYSDDTLGGTGEVHRFLSGRYLDFLEAIGHDFSDTDRKYAATAAGDTQPPGAGVAGGNDAEDAVEPHPYVSGDVALECVDCGHGPDALIHEDES